MDYLKKSLKKLNISQDYEEVDTKIASGWYVEPIEGNIKKKSIGLFFCNKVYRQRNSI